MQSTALSAPVASKGEILSAWLLDVLSLVGPSEVIGTRAPLAHRSDAGGRSLSGGQARRVAVARALLARPNVLLADEPAEGLDPRAAAAFAPAVRRSDPAMTLVLALRDQQVSQLSWRADLCNSPCSCPAGAAEFGQILLPSRCQKERPDRRLRRSGL